MRVFQAGWIVIAILCLPTEALAGYSDLVTRDDFVCMDTAVFGSTYVSWVDVAIDESGIISETDGRDTIPEFGYYLVYQFNRFDKYGNQMQQPINFLPYMHNDTSWGPDGWVQCYSNADGITFLPVVEHPAAAPYDVWNFVHRFDASGQPMDYHRCFNCQESQVRLQKGLPFGGITDGGVVGAAWKTQLRKSSGLDSLYVRLYYPATDSLSPLLNPKALPNPLDGESVYTGSYNIPRDPRMKIAEDNSFVVTWTAEYGWRHIYFVVYNADYTVRAPVQLANCEGGFFDTAQCVTKQSDEVELAMEPDGDFYIAWWGSITGGRTEIANHTFLSGYNADGSRKYGPLRIDDQDSLWYGFPQETCPSVACDSSGNVLIVWSDCRLDPDDNWGWSSANLDCYAQKIDPEGNLVGPNYKINNSMGSLGRVWGYWNRCDMNESGQTVILWKEPDAQFSVKAQLMPYDQVGRFVPGDINYSLACDITDLLALVDYLFKGARPSFWPRDLIDLNGDGSDGDIADLMHVVSYLFGGGPVPATPDEGIRIAPPLPYY